MPAARQETQQANRTAAAYATGLDYLSDELRRLDLLIQFRLLRERHSTPPTPLDQFKGLVITDEEISRLLTDASSRRQDDRLSDLEQELTLALGRLESHIQQRLVASTGKSI